MRVFPNLNFLKWSSISYIDPFIVQREHDQDNIRDYLVFDGVDEYLSSTERSCHEVFIAGLSPDSDVMAHPAFDIDMKLDKAYQGWESDFEQDVRKAMKSIFPCLDTDTLEFVWLISATSGKVSRHIVVQGVTFQTWRYTMTVLIKQLSSWGHAVDAAIYRKKGSLRLPLNRKKGKDSPILTFRDSHHTFKDGLVMIYNYNAPTISNLLSKDDMEIHDDSIDQVIGIDIDADEIYDQEDDLEANASLAKRAFQRIDKMYDTGLVMKKSDSGSFITLVREKPGKCPLSRTVHDSENGYLNIKDNKVLMGCHRKCTITYGGKPRKVRDITPI